MASKIMNQAEQVAENFGWDGQVWNTDDGRGLDDVCREVAGSPTYRDGYRTDVYRYDFPDGSSIVCAGAGWDFGLPGGCYCWAGAQPGHGEDCASGAVDESIYCERCGADHGPDGDGLSTYQGAPVCAGCLAAVLQYAALGYHNDELDLVALSEINREVWLAAEADGIADAIKARLVEPEVAPPAPKCNAPDCNAAPDVSGYCDDHWAPRLNR